MWTRARLPLWTNLGKGGAVAGSRTFDPRFLVFEFTYNMVLRPQQYGLVRKFMAAVEGAGLRW